jgi:hypothetical protein
MLASEFPQFETVVRRLEKVFSKKIDDETMQAYWGALKDQHLATFKRFADRHERYGKFFPKPFELRAKEDKLPEVQGGKDDATFREGEERAIKRLEKLRQDNPAEWIKQVAEAKGDACNAIQLHRQYGEQLWYDLPNRCWRV